jgi:hypothetical protein
MSSLHAERDRGGKTLVALAKLLRKLALAH